MLGKIHYGVDEVISKSSGNVNGNFLFDNIEDYVLPIIEKHLGNIAINRHRLSIVEQRVDDLEHEVKQLKYTQQNVIIIEEMDIETAKQKVLEYMKVHEVFDIEDLHQNIRCNLKLLIKIIDDLKKEGRIKEEF